MELVDKAVILRKISELELYQKQIREFSDIRFYEELSQRTTEIIEKGCWRILSENEMINTFFLYYFFRVI